MRDVMVHRPAVPGSGSTGQRGFGRPRNGHRRTDEPRPLYPPVRTPNRRLADPVGSGPMVRTALECEWKIGGSNALPSFSGHRAPLPIKPSMTGMAIRNPCPARSHRSGAAAGGLPCVAPRGHRPALPGRRAL